MFFQLHFYVVQKYSNLIPVADILNICQPLVLPFSHVETQIGAIVVPCSQALSHYVIYYIAPLNNMRNLKFKSPRTVAFSLPSINAAEVFENE